ncbi:MAG: DUF4129 domain-containing protein [Acidimicrobiia bacterium]|nr:DUF4129 domain-containing protein [Acidimicrobiia bacterium]
MRENRSLGPKLPPWAVVLLVAAGVGLAGLAAIGARQMPGTGTSRRMASELGWDPLTVLTWLVLALLGFVAFMVLSSPRGRMERAGGGRRRSRPIALFLVLAVVAAVILSVGPGGGDGREGRQVGLPGEGSLAEAPPQQVAGSAWVLVLFAGAILVAIAVLSHVRGRGPADDAPDVTGIIASVDAAIFDLELGGDPRTVVIAAYTRMEMSLAGAGVPRRRHEAPLEYVERSLRRLEVDAEAIVALTGLFEEARFSTHMIGENMAAEAIAALREIRAGLATV